MDILTPELFLMDSLLIVNGFSQGLDELGNASIELRKMVREQTERIMETRINPPKRVLDSVRLLQYNLDVENTKILLNIISRLERKDNALRAYKCARESFIVFVHTPDKYKDQVRKEIERIDLRSIDEDQYDHIMWHLNGRN